MALLKFKGNPDHRIPKANSYFVGGMPQYLGLEITDGKVTPVEFTVDDTTSEGQQLLNLARRDQSILPVDDAAYAAIGLEKPTAKKAAN